VRSRPRPPRTRPRTGRSTSCPRQEDRALVAHEGSFPAHLLRSAPRVSRSNPDGATVFLRSHIRASLSSCPPIRSWYDRKPLRPVLGRILVRATPEVKPGTSCNGRLSRVAVSWRSSEHLDVLARDQRDHLRQPEFVQEVREASNSVLTRKTPLQVEVVAFSRELTACSPEAA